MGEHTERPILFSSAMVQAILAGRKTQTRRVVKPQPPHDGNWLPKEHSEVLNCWIGYTQDGRLRNDVGCRPNDCSWFCPYGVPGDRLYVRETWGYRGSAWHNQKPEIKQVSIAYRADGAEVKFTRPSEEEVGRKPNMPVRAKGEDFCDYELRCADYFSRYWKSWSPAIHMPKWASRITLEIEQVRVERIQEISQEDAVAEGRQCVAHLRETWDALNEKRGYGWNANPFCWVLTFKRV